MKMYLLYIVLLFIMSCDFYETQYDILEVSYDFSLAYNTSIDVYNRSDDSIKIYYKSKTQNDSIIIPPDYLEVVIESHVVNYDFVENYMIFKHVPIKKIDGIDNITYDEKKNEIEEYMYVKEYYEYYIYEKEKYLFFGPLTKDQFKKEIRARGIDSPYWL